MNALLKGHLTGFFLFPISFLSLGADGSVASVDFNQDIRPILSENCYKCHGADPQDRKADLRLDRPEDARRQLKTGHTAIVDGDPSRSALWLRITTEDLDERMPPMEHGPSLTREQMDLLQRWIQQGAHYDKHWAFEPVVKPSLPVIKDPARASNPIDLFVLNRLDAMGWANAAPSDPNTLLRRLSFDLRGLPPSPSERQSFLDDTRPDAYLHLVDRWLASPRYGERMAQHWLDAARYADTTGHAADAPRTMWLYRDWVIRALNRNMPFDQFTIEQIAGDMLPGATQSQRIATGFHRNSMQALGNNPRKEEFRVKGIVDRLDTTGRVWMGLTVSCAECHDHKYDPLSTREYYQLYAIFNNVPHLGEKFQVHGPRLEVLPPELQRAWDQHQAVIDAAGRKLAGRIDHPLARELQQQVEDSQKLQEALKKHVIMAQVMDELPVPRATHVHLRGNFEHKGERVYPGTPAVLPGFPPGKVVNRLTFARWLVDERHPLTARVTVNRLWGQFFGMGLVQSDGDFGLRGSPPSHPDLLDWLAITFMQSGWNYKALVRQMVTSETYRQSSILRPALADMDPQNRFLGRAPRLRMAAEQIRDNALAVGGLLADRIGGPSAYPFQPAGVGEFRDATAGQWVSSQGEGRHRRSLYTFWQRMSPYPSQTIFDAPTRERTCVRREITNTPLQALVLLNDPAYHATAVALAQRILRDGTSFETQIRDAFRWVLSRLPGPEEWAQFAQREEHWRLVEGKSPLEVWTLLSQVLLNLDETITKE